MIGHDGEPPRKLPLRGGTKTVARIASTRPVPSCRGLVPRLAQGCPPTGSPGASSLTPARVRTVDENFAELLARAGLRGLVPEGCATGALEAYNCPVPAPVPPAPVPVVLRLAEQALDEGRLAGEVELVETGERALVSCAEELVSFLRAHRRPLGETAGPEGPEAWAGADGRAPVHRSNLRNRRKEGRKETNDREPEARN